VVKRKATCFHPLNLEVAAESFADEWILHQSVMPMWQVIRHDVGIARDDIHTVVQLVIWMLKQRSIT